MLSQVFKTQCQSGAKVMKRMLKKRIMNRKRHGCFVLVG